MNRCAVLGDPISHSLSPVLHRAAYDALGLDWTYDAHRVEAGGLTAFVADLDDSWRGLSLTMPLKREALALAGSVSAQARAAGAANTLVRDGEGWQADNTDVPGALAALNHRGVGRIKRGVILGAGATAASVGLALVQKGAHDLTIMARDAARAKETLNLLREHPTRPNVRLGGLAGSQPIAADVVVSTLPVSAQHPDLVGRCDGVPVVFEVAYHPWPTPLATSVRDRVLVTGLDLLVHQAALQAELFIGIDPEVLAGTVLPAMRAAGEAALAARGAE